MPVSFIDVLALVITYVVFGPVGFVISRKFKRPVALATWIVLVILTFGCTFFARSALLLGLGEFGIHLNIAIQAIGVGIIIGLATREIRVRAEKESV